MTTSPPSARGARAGGRPPDRAGEFRSPDRGRSRLGSGAPAPRPRRARAELTARPGRGGARWPPRAAAASRPPRPPTRRRSAPTRASRSPPASSASNWCEELARGAAWPPARFALVGGLHAIDIAHGAPGVGRALVGPQLFVGQRRPAMIAAALEAARRPARAPAARSPPAADGRQRPSSASAAARRTARSSSSLGATRIPWAAGKRRQGLADQPRRASSSPSAARAIPSPAAERHEQRRQRVPRSFAQPDVPPARPDRAHPRCVSDGSSAGPIAGATPILSSAPRRRRRGLNSIDAPADRGRAGSVQPAGALRRPARRGDRPAAGRPLRRRRSAGLVPARSSRPSRASMICSPGLRIVYARGGAGTREAIVLMPAAPALGDAVAHAARLAGGQVFTGAGKHFVQFREPRAPLGYDVEALSDGAGDLIFYGLEETVPYRIESELPLGNLLLRLSLVRLHGRAVKVPEGHDLPDGAAGTRHGGGRAPAPRRAAGTCAQGRLRATATRASRRLSARAPPPAPSHRARRSGSSGSSDCRRGSTGCCRRRRAWSSICPSPTMSRWPSDYRHPIHLEACRASFAADRLHLFCPARRDRGGAAAGVRRHRGPGPDPGAVAGDRRPSRRRTPVGRPDLAVALRLEPVGRRAPARWPRSSPGGRSSGCSGCVYALPPTALRAYRVALLKRGVLVRAAEVLDGIPSGRCTSSARPRSWSPLGTRIRARGLAADPGGAPGRHRRRHGAVPRARVRRRCGFFPRRSSRFDRRLLAEIEPALANLEALGADGARARRAGRDRERAARADAAVGAGAAALTTWRAGSSRGSCCRSCGAARCASAGRSGHGRWRG